MHKEGHQVESKALEKLGIAVYVPSVSELRAKSEIIRPFCGQLLDSEFRFPRTVDIGTALTRLIERFGLPNAPEYHEWSEDFMNVGRMGSYWEYIFQVNEKQYFFVSHDYGKLTVGCRTTSDKKTCEAFFRFIKSAVMYGGIDWRCQVGGLHHDE